MKNIIAVWDLETTGVDLSKDEVVQFGAVRYENDKVVDKLEFLCKPSVSIHPDAAKTHGITEEMIKDAKPFKFYAVKVAKILDGAIQGGYNIKGFDIPILSRQMEQSGYPAFFKNSYVFDAFDLFKQHCTRTLGDAYAFYGHGKLENAHDAIVDVEATYKIIASQVVREQMPMHEVAAKTCPPPGKRVGFSGHVVFDENDRPILNFGKNKGIPLEQVDKGFLKWMISKDFPVEVKDYVAQYL